MGKKTKTDMQGVLDTALMLLYITPTRNERVPFLVDHPVFDSETYMLKSGEMVSILEDSQMIVSDVNGEPTSIRYALGDVLEQLKKTFQSYTSSLDFLMMIRSAYYLTFFKFCNGYLSEKDYGEMLATCWTEEENPNRDTNVSLRESISYFKHANPLYLMSDAERNVIANMPDEITVYRGVGKNRAEKGLSYTTSIEKAGWFAKRWGATENDDIYILTGTIKKENILAYFDRRGEFEVVVDPRDIDGLKKIPVSEM